MLGIARLLSFPPSWALPLAVVAVTLTLGGVYIAGVALSHDDLAFEQPLDSSSQPSGSGVTTGSDAGSGGPGSGGLTSSGAGDSGAAAAGGATGSGDGTGLLDASSGGPAAGAASTQAGDWSFTATPGAVPGEVVLSWAAPVPRTQSQGFVVERSSSPTGPFVTVGQTTQDSFVDSAPAPGATYYYQIQTVDSTGDSTQSSSGVEGAVAYPGGASTPAPELGTLVLTAGGLGLALVVGATRRRA